MKRFFSIVAALSLVCWACNPTEEQPQQIDDPIVNPEPVNPEKPETPDSLKIPDKITITPDWVELKVGETVVLTADAEPQGDWDITWICDGDVVTVDQEGRVTAEKEGQTVVTAFVALTPNDVPSPNDPNIGRAVIHVSPADIPLEGIEIATAEGQGENLEIVIGETLQLVASATPEGAYFDQDPQWSSTDTQVATVDGTGLVSAVGVGNCEIVCEVGDISSRIPVAVLGIPVTAVVIAGDAAGELAIGESIQLTATYEPANATDAVIEWESSDPAVATVDQTGLVTAVAAGTAIITATAGGQSATFTLTVPEPAVQEVMWCDAVDMGVSVKWASANLGAQAITADGNRYAWGETEPKENYDYSTYKHTNKYNSSDGLTVIQPEDDAATVNLGEGWSTPNKAQWVELIQNCRVIETTVGGVMGELFISKVNGNQIFMPRTMYQYGTAPNNQYSYYMTSELFSGRALVILQNFGGGYVTGQSQQQYFGYPVRAVSATAEQTASIDVNKFDLVKGQSAKRSVSGLSSTPVWHTSDAAIATVSSDGTVTAVSLGDALIWATGSNGKGYASTLVTVTPSGEAVDMGSLIWASQNLGADTPGDYGYYYAWGEVATKETYTTNNYRWGKFMGGRLYVTKYKASDGKTVLEADDDAATVNLGGSWRMPTQAEAESLINTCTYTQVTYHGHYCIKFTAAGGADIVMPCADQNAEHGYDSSDYYLGFKNRINSERLLQVWTATRYDDANEGHAMAIYTQLADPIVSKLSCKVESFSRSTGFTVRPVRDK